MTSDSIVAPPLDGEWPDIAVRLVTSPAVGAFRPAAPHVTTAEGEWVHRDQIIGTVETSMGPLDVVSPFAGFHMGLVAGDGERVVSGQPVVWLWVSDRMAS